MPCANPDCRATHDAYGVCINCSYCDDCKLYKGIWGTLYTGAIAIDTDPIISKIAPRFFGYGGTYTPTGNYSQTFAAMTVPSAIGDITLSHTYNSLDASEETILSKGFTFGYSMRIDTVTSQERGTTVTYKNVILPQGQQWSFKQLANGTFEAMDSRGVLKTVNGAYVLETLDKMKYTFKTDGSIQSIEDPQGQRPEYRRKRIK